MTSTDKQIEERKKRRFEIFNSMMTVISATEGRLNEVELSSNVDSMFKDFVSYVHILSYQWIRPDKRRV